jgi:hypothetical protein
MDWQKVNEQNLVRQRSLAWAPQETLGSRDVCWCGAPQNHNWPGREDGSPHPKERQERNMADDFEVRTAEDVTDEVLEIVQGIVEGWYDEGRIDWEDVWDRMEKSVLDDGRGIDMGEDLGSPAIKKIKSEIRKWRALG